MIGERGYEPTEDELAAEAVLQQEYTRYKKQQADDSDKGLPGFMMKKTVEFEAARQAARKACEDRLKGIDTEERSMHWRWGQAVRQEVDRQLSLQTGKKPKKSIITDFGKMGYRLIKATVTIVDIEAARTWAVNKLKGDKLLSAISAIDTQTAKVLAVTHLKPDELRTAISALNKTPFFEAVILTNEIDAETGEVIVKAAPPDGCEFVPEYDKFYPTPPKAKQLIGDNHG